EPEGEEVWLVPFCPTPPASTTRIILSFFSTEPVLFIPKKTKYKTGHVDVDYRVDRIFYSSEKNTQILALWLGPYASGKVPVASLLAQSNQVSIRSWRSRDLVWQGFDSRGQTTNNL